MPVSLQGGDHQGFNIIARSSDIEIPLAKPINTDSQKTFFFRRLDTRFVGVRIDSQWELKPGGFLLLKVERVGQTVKYRRQRFSGGVIELNVE
jgi:hypothetical protein